MGGRAQVVVVGAPDLTDWAVGRVAQLEERWSRFIPTSDVSRANRAAGAEVPVDADTVMLATTALRAHAETDGAYDPLLGDVMAQLGYDRTFDSVDPRTRPILSGPSRAGRLVVDDDRARLLVPSGCSFDPGGIGKGLAADLVTAGLADRGAEGALVNLGGDIRVWGEPPTEDGWVLSVDHPMEEGAELVRVVLADGAVASTSRLRRCWGPPEARAHHLVDPATRRPADNGVAAVTVFAGTGWRAEAFTKAAFLAGPDGGVGVLEAHGLDGIVVTDDGESRMTPNMAAISV